MARFKIKRRLRQARRQIGLLWSLLRENSPSVVARFFALRRSIGNEVIELRIGGATLSIRVGTPDIWVARSCLVQGEFAVLMGLVERPRHNFILDAGGHIGAAAIALARMYPQATILSLEPSRENFILLEKNTKPFPNIVPINKALLGSSRVAMLSDRGTGQWGFTLVHETREDRELVPLHEVSAISVSDIMRDHSVDGIDILKLDIEGSEKDVLENSESWMPKVEVVVAELHDRIVSGCSEAYEAATEGMCRVNQKGEKVVSIRNGVARP